MRSADCDILIVPGLGNSGPEHWQSRWEGRLSTARRVEQDDWDWPRREAWIERLVEEVALSERPAVLIAHSLGVVAAALAAPSFPPERVRGAFLVALPDVGSPHRVPAIARPFAPLPHDPLPFPSLLVASSTDPHCAYECAEDIAYAWGSALIDAGDAGHLNTASGFGPWPEGLMRFAAFMRTL